MIAWEVVHVLVKGTSNCWPNRERRRSVIEMCVKSGRKMQGKKMGRRKFAVR